MNNNNKRSGSGSLVSWLKKHKKTNDTSITRVPDPEVVHSENSEGEVLGHLPSLPAEKTPSSSVEYKDLSTDFSDYLDGKIVNDYNKVRLLELSNVPGNDFIYPYSVHNKKGKDEKRFLNKAHFEKFNWLVYLKKAGGIFCKFCILFANKGGKDKNIDLKSLVTVPLTKFAKILGKDGILSKHNQHIYHLNAVSTSNDFLICYENPEKDIINLVNTSRMKQVTENRLRLKPIIETVVLCGRQNIPLRGHRDQGDLLSFKNQHNASVVNEGNFRELLRFRISAGDKILENHLQTTTSKATYISHTTQEDIISCCKDEIIFNILENVKVSKYYSIIFDETTDVSHTFQMSLILRNVDSENKVYERFISFIDCHSHVYGKTNVNVGLENIEDELGHNILEPKLSGKLLAVCRVGPQRGEMEIAPNIIVPDQPAGPSRQSMIVNNIPNNDFNDGYDEMCLDVLENAQDAGLCDVSGNKRVHEENTRCIKSKKARMDKANASGFVEVKSAHSRKIVWYYAKYLDNFENYISFLANVKPKLEILLRRIVSVNPIKFNLKLEATYNQPHENNSSHKSILNSSTIN
ncbi:hypothetical protein QTP88_001738 [Uroleucon formosanum]